jgi:hypothetical protein
VRVPAVGTLRGINVPTFNAIALRRGTSVPVKCPATTESARQACKRMVSPFNLPRGKIFARSTN